MKSNLISNMIIARFVTLLRKMTLLKKKIMTNVLKAILLYLTCDPLHNILIDVCWGSCRS